MILKYWRILILKHWRKMILKVCTLTVSTSNNRKIIVYTLIHLGWWHDLEINLLNPTYIFWNKPTLRVEPPPFSWVLMLSSTSDGVTSQKSPESRSATSEPRWRVVVPPARSVCSEKHKSGWQDLFLTRQKDYNVIHKIISYKCLTNLPLSLFVQRSFCIQPMMMI